MKALVGAFNQEKALVGAFSVIVQPVVEPMDRFTALNRILIFVLYKKEASRIESSLSSRGWKVTSIHGDKSQEGRTKAVEDFKSGAIPLLVATDVAARGLDIPGVDFVINYSFPLTIEDYVHRYSNCYPLFVW